MKLAVHLLLLILLAACSSEHSKDGRTFSLLTVDQTGIDFINTVSEEKFSSETANEFAYMGGGVGVLDINNDGLKDLFFCGNQVNNRLYLNRGRNRFEDVTALLGSQSAEWTTGVSIVDINADGWDDIFLCSYGPELSRPGSVQLLINQAGKGFTEQAAAYGFRDKSYSTQAVFFDYDGDGDLDMYLLNYQLNASYAANNIKPRDLSGKSLANDRLYRNEGDSAGLGHPVFRDVSAEAGIVDDGYGLGVSVSDFNKDGWPDIYVSNDFLSNDCFWLNTGDGHFRNILDQATNHQSYSSMGADAADINNDLLIDFSTLDMMPELNERKKVSNFAGNYERYQSERRMGYSPEFGRNMLQLNRGLDPEMKDHIPVFSDIGQMAGISETDWSWSILMADFNNDGYKDIHITNGIGRDFTNADFQQYSQTVFANSTDPADARRLMNEKLRTLEPVKLANYLYLNNRNLGFSDAGAAAGIDRKSLSTGAAYADLDNDGDLDLVVNNINEPPFIWRNDIDEPGKEKTVHSVQFELKADAANRNGIGTRIILHAGGSSQLLEQQPVRGFLSSVDNKLFFGLGTVSLIDSVQVIWPDKTRQVFYKLTPDSCYVLKKDSTAIQSRVNPKQSTKFLFEEISDQLGVNYFHTDAVFNDYAVQRLLPQKYSQLGPFVAVADLNADSRADFFAGGGFNSAGQVFLQQADGKFQQLSLDEKMKMSEDEDCLFFDADGDGDQDLIISSGDVRYPDSSAYYKPRLFLNDGRGHFKLDSFAIPGQVRTIAGTVSVADFNKDGQPDLFIGGRVSKEYPKSPRSFLLMNNQGRFIDVTSDLCADLSYPGMIAGSCWMDINTDQLPDLVIAGEWQPIRFFVNRGNKFEEVSKNTVQPSLTGNWRSLVSADVDNDGDTDLIAGNLGLNNKYHVSASNPLTLLAKDIDGNGSIEPVLFYYIKNEQGERKLYPAISRDALAEQFPGIKKQFLTHAAFAEAGVDDIFPDKKGLMEFRCEETASVWLENVGNGKFTQHVLPVMAQMAPVNAILCSDFDGDGRNDILLAGNEYQAEVQTGQYDASYGLFLKGTAAGFLPQRPEESGFFVRGDVKDLQIIEHPVLGKMVIVAVNDSRLKIFRVVPPRP